MNSGAARADQVAEILREEGIDTVDLVFASHNHADHIGGMPGVLECCVIRAYLENGVAHTSQIYMRTMQAVEMEPGLQYLRATDRTLTLGSLKLQILALPARVLRITTAPSACWCNSGSSTRCSPVTPNDANSASGLRRRRCPASRCSRRPTTEPGTVSRKNGQPLLHLRPMSQALAPRWVPKGGSGSARAPPAGWNP